jgi:SpoIID/LytB domain protein
MTRKHENTKTRKRKSTKPYGSFRGFEFRGFVRIFVAAFFFATLAFAATQESTSQIRVGLARPGGGYTIVTLPMDTYIARVLGGEAARDSQPAALAALAITARTFAVANRGRHRADGFDVCDQTHCQVVRTATAATEHAAQATTGQVLLHGNTVATVYYTASCGGRTEIPSAVWPGHEDLPYLSSRDDDACGGAPVWVAQLGEGDVLRALRAFGFRGDRLRDLRIASRDKSGRVARLRVEGLQPDEISGQDLRVAVGRTMGWQHIKSTAFDLRKLDDVYRFSGHGSGHGVGLCVIGSARLAEDGKDVAYILGRYFPGLKVSSTSLVATSTRSTPAAASAGGAPKRGVNPAEGRMTPGSSAPAAAIRPEPNLAAGAVAVSLPDDDAGEQAPVTKQTLKARDDLARTLGVTPPARVTLRFHPTTDDYERATGQAWFTSAAVVQGEMHLLPIAVLRERGILDRTIRHELVHLMTDSILGQRPLWVREGAAIYFAGEPPIPGETVQRPAFKPLPRASCPDDSELRQPISVGALTNAYARARACFARQIQSGRTWRDVR